MLTSSGSAFVAPDGFGNSIASSRNHARTSTPSSASLEVVVAAAPRPPSRISSGVHIAATLPGPAARALPLGDVDRQDPADPGQSNDFQNWRWEIDVSAHSESR